METQTKRTSLTIAMAAILGVSLSAASSAAPLADGFYDMVINNTPYTLGSGYDSGTDGAWNSSFTVSCLPGEKGCSSRSLYDDTIAQPVNGRYAGNVSDGVQGTVAIQVSGGVITGTGGFEFDTIPSTGGGDFGVYGNSRQFLGSIDALGNISLTTTGLLAAFSDFPSLVDEAWNIDNFNGITGAGTNPVLNPPNSNTAYDAFSTGSATNAAGTISGAAYDGSTAILVKGGTLGSQWGGFFGAQYFEVWNVSFIPATVPIPAAAWLFGSGLIGLIGVARRKRPGIK